MKVFYNGKVLTMDERQPLGEALAVQGDKILAVGSNEDILALASAKDPTWDLQGGLVVPGFNDSHLHLLNWGMGMSGVDLSPARSLADLSRLGQEYLQAHPQQEWIIGRGWNDEQFLDKRLPSKEDLDGISTSLPIVFVRACGHVCVANSAALAKAGINETMPNPEGGSIDRSLSGEPTGILRENAISLVTSLLPTPNKAELKEIILQAAHSAAALGLTTVQSNDLSGAASLTTRLEAYSELAVANKLPIRIILQATMPTLPDLQAYLEARATFPQLGPYLALGPLKLYADGSLGARTAALSHPYHDDPQTNGMLIYEQEQLNELVLLAAKNNLQVAIHAIGDLALDQVITSYELAQASFPAWTGRPRVVHCQITRCQQLDKMAALGIVADIQPIFVPTDLHFVAARIGPKNVACTYAWKTMQQKGVHLAGGSDCPVESCNPLWGMHAAITRQDRGGFPAGGWLAQERLSFPEALALFTIGSAYAAQEERIKGSLSPGKLADFVILPADAHTANARQLLDMQVIASFVGGTATFGFEGH